MSDKLEIEAMNVFRAEHGNCPTFAPKYAGIWVQYYQVYKVLCVCGFVRNYTIQLLESLIKNRVEAKPVRPPGKFCDHLEAKPVLGNMWGCSVCTQSEKSSRLFSDDDTKKTVLSNTWWTWYAAKLYNYSSIIEKLEKGQMIVFESENSARAHCKKYAIKSIKSLLISFTGVPTTTVTTHPSGSLRTAFADGVHNLSSKEL